MIIRKLKPEDKKLICMLSDQINQEHYENMPTDFKEPDGQGSDWEHWCAFDNDERGILLVAEDGDVAVGFIAGRVVDSGKSSYLVPKKKLQISTIVVEQSTRGQGIGRALVESAVSVSRSMGATEAFLEVMAYNAGAEKFYSALGFGKFSTKLSMQFIRPAFE